MDTADLGRRLRDLRAGRDLSLAQVQAETGVSSSFLSLVEQGRSDISIGRLAVLAGFYGVEIGELVAQPASPDDIAVFRHGTEPQITGPGLDVALLAPAQWSLIPTLSWYQPGVVTVIEQDLHETFMYVVDGPFEIAFADAPEPHRLEDGDAIIYRRGQRYTTTYVGEAIGVLLGVSVAA